MEDHWCDFVPLPSVNHIAYWFAQPCVTEIETDKLLSFFKWHAYGDVSEWIINKGPVNKWTEQQWKEIGWIVNKDYFKCFIYAFSTSHFLFAPSLNATTCDCISHDTDEAVGRLKLNLINWAIWGIWKSNQKSLNFNSATWTSLWLMVCNRLGTPCYKCIINTVVTPYARRMQTYLATDGIAFPSPSNLTQPFALIIHDLIKESSFGTSWLSKKTEPHDTGCSKSILKTA